MSTPPTDAQGDAVWRIGGHPVTRADYLAMTSALGYGDDVSEPAATPGELHDPLEEALTEAANHRAGCPEWCDVDGQWEQPRSCEHCNGSGCSPLTALGAYDPCGWCAGEGRKHEPWPATTHTDTAAQALRDAVELNVGWEWQTPCEGDYDLGYARGYENARHAVAGELTDALSAAQAAQVPAPTPASTATVLAGHQVIGTMPNGPATAAQQCGCDGTWRDGPTHAEHLATALEDHR